MRVKRFLFLLFSLAASINIAKASQSTAKSHWGHFVRTGITGGASAIMQVKVSGVNSAWHGTFVLHGLLNSYMANTSSWNTVSLIDWAGYNTAQSTVRLELMSQNNGSGFEIVEAVLVTDLIESGAAITVTAVATGLGTEGLSLTSSSTQPYSYTLRAQCLIIRLT